MKNVNNTEEENIKEAERMIKNRSLVAYQVLNEDIQVCVQLNDVKDIIGIVVGNVKYSEVKWIYDSDLYKPEEPVDESKPKRKKINQIFDYLFGPSFHDKQNKFENNLDTKELPAPSLSIDALIDKALSKLSGPESIYESNWTPEAEDAAIREYLDDEANNLQPDPAKSDKASLPDDAITGWVRVAWPDKGITTVEHISFLRELV